MAAITTKKWQDVSGHFRVESTRVIRWRYRLETWYWVHGASYNLLQDRLGLDVTLA
jgi:hypothetical protein